MAKIAKMRYSFLISLCCLLLGLAACNDDHKQPTDTIDSGNVNISVDETYRPIIEQQLKVFDSSYPNAHITAQYKPESECIQDLLHDKARMVLVTRELNAAEIKYCEENAIAPTTQAIVRDAIAVIVNPASTDTALSITQLTGILTGVYNKKYTVVFDNEGSSTVRYITDSLLKGQQLGKNVFAAKGNPAVVDYVARNPNAIGLIGLSYISDDQDDSTESFLSKIKVVAMKDPGTGEYNKPYQAYVALKTYPLTRHLYYINRETWQGLGSGFCNFLSNQRGQLIFFHAHFFPLRSNIIIRDAAITQ